MPDLLGDFAYTWPFALGFLGGYFLGAIPVGLLLTQLAGQGDIRKIGSGNIGATNVLRTGKKGLAALTMVLDICKAAGAVLIAQNFGPDMAIFAGAGAVLGHMFPVWLKFQGGKGVAASLGVMLALAWPVGLAMFGMWLGVLLVFRISSLAALVAATATPLAAKFLASPQVFEFSIAMATLVISRHWQNIVRLVQGKEPRVGGGNPN
jgi:glycerol-3-phosphate acyltransferase PlsY